MAGGARSEHGAETQVPGGEHEVARGGRVGPLVARTLDVAADDAETGVEPDALEAEEDFRGAGGDGVMSSEEHLARFRAAPGMNLERGASGVVLEDLRQ